MEEHINYAGWPDCIRLSNGEADLIIATDIGPRILRFGFIGRQNIFHLIPDDSGKLAGSDWRNYGGHRLWLSPEAIPFSYYPDNDPVAYTYDGHTLKLTQPKETTSGIVKEMEISLSPVKNQVTVLHRLINQSSDEITVAPWAISVLGQGGKAIVPQEPFGEGNDYLLPARPLALWQYTKMNDPRWTWGAKYILAKQDVTKSLEQKIGVLNKQGWVAYHLNDDLLIKQFKFDAAVEYPDLNCNNEIYINGNFLEVETLGALTKIPSGGIAEHKEEWLLTKATPVEGDDAIDSTILPLVNAFKNEVRL